MVSTGSADEIESILVKDLDWVIMEAVGSLSSPWLLKETPGGISPAVDVVGGGIIEAVGSLSFPWSLKETPGGMSPGVDVVGGSTKDERTDDLSPV